MGGRWVRANSRVVGWWATVLVAALLRPIINAVPAAALSQPADSYVADQATPYHDGNVTGDHLAPPLSER